MASWAVNKILKKGTFLLKSTGLTKVDIQGNYVKKETEVRDIKLYIYIFRIYIIDMRAHTLGLRYQGFIKQNLFWAFGKLNRNLELQLTGIAAVAPEFNLLKTWHTEKYID